jgi:hypothetical protein
MTRTLLSIWIFTAALILLCVQPASAQAKPAPGIEELSRLDLLPAFRQSVKVGSISSYDRTGGNDDGFNGTYSLVRKEPGGLVIAALKGPGVIYRIWTPTPTDDMVEFYFDEEPSPRIRVRFIGLFSGKQSPFLSPVVGIAGRADKTQAQVRRLMQSEYRTGRAGLPGNDDSGTMSSWYVWNAVGLYLNAGQDFYYVGSPLFTRVAINLANNRTFLIEAPNSSATNKYVHSATLNGKSLNRAYLTHAEISGGGKLILEMSDKPSSWGSTNRPPSMTRPLP